MEMLGERVDHDHFAYVSVFGGTGEFDEPSRGALTHADDSFGAKLTQMRVEGLVDDVDGYDVVCVRIWVFVPYSCDEKRKSMRGRESRQAERQGGP